MHESALIAMQLVGMSGPDKYYQWFVCQLGRHNKWHSIEVTSGQANIWISGLDTGIENMPRMSVMDANIYDENRLGS